MKQKSFAATALALGLAGTLAGAGCSLKDPQPPSLTGPSTFGVGVRLTASPDIVLANGFDTSVVQAHLTDQNGQGLGGRDVIFTITDDTGRQADIGDLRSRSGETLGTSVIERSDGSGLAQVIYEAPARTDITANTSILVTARPIGTDAEAGLYRRVRIELRNAEPKLFPPNPTNVAPKCGFVVQAPDGYRAGRPILFQDTSSDSDGTIVRYEWFWGDGTYSDHPDNAKVWTAAGTYTVNHIVTDNNGAQNACAATLTLF
jgi:PKD domain